MYNLTSIGTIKEITLKHGFEFSKRLGQNFLINPSVCPKIAELGGAENRGVIEVGGGIGVLTAELAKTAQKVVCVELDKKLLPVLGDTLRDFENVIVVNSDIMKTDLKKLIAEHFNGVDVVVCANLPYYITSPVIMRFLEEKLPIKCITVMVQKEAAARLCAKIPSREAGAVTYAVNYYGSVKKLFNVKRGSFYPAPNVDSTVIRVDVHPRPPFDLTELEEKVFFKLLKAAFSERRKTLVNALASGLDIEKKIVAQALLFLGLNENVRAEEMGMGDFSKLTSLIPF